MTNIPMWDDIHSLEWVPAWVQQKPWILKRVKENVGKKTNALILATAVSVVSMPWCHKIESTGKIAIVEWIQNKDGIIDLDALAKEKETYARQLEAIAKKLESDAKTLQAERLEVWKLEIHIHEVQQYVYMMDKYNNVSGKIIPILNKILLVPYNEQKKLRSELRELVWPLRHAEIMIWRIVPLSQKNTNTQKYLLEEIKSLYPLIQNAWVKI